MPAAPEPAVPRPAPRCAILRDPSITPLPSYTDEDAARALVADALPVAFTTVAGLATLTRADCDVLVLPYLDGDLSGAPLDGLLRFHAQGGGLLMLGDTPHVGRSFPYRHSQAPDLRLTRCRDPLTLHGLSPKGHEILGDLPDLARMLGREMSGVRTSAFPPDICHALFDASGGFKQLSPVVLVERHDPRFLGARAAVVGHDGGEPRENIMGVCHLPWTFDPGLLDRTWAGADVMVSRLARAVSPPALAVALDFAPVVPAGSRHPVRLHVRNLTNETQSISVLHGDSATLITDLVIPPHRAVVMPAPGYAQPVGPGPEVLRAQARVGTHQVHAERTRFGCLAGPPPDLTLGFSTFRVFRTPQVDGAYRDFLHATGRLGMQYVRMALAWEDLEPEPGRYQWEVADQMLEAAAHEKLAAFFWIFPTARGSGLGEGGVPAWTLREPAIDRDGRPGNFPCIWSPFYRERYFGFLTALTLRYAHDPRLSRFVFDFGNSDFPYSYHFYGDRGDRFDYSPFEQSAFARWLARREVPLADVSRRWDRAFRHWDEVPVPLAEQPEAWLLYDEFRVWGVHQGIKEAVGIIHRHAPAKAPPDFPGHGLGSIADLGTYVHHAQARHWAAVQRTDPALTEAHNMGPQWGGEAWQVGGRYPDYDDALFQSVRLAADYLTIPGPDLGVWEDDIARVAMIRRSLAGARRPAPRVAILDHMEWHAWTSLAQVGSRLDQPVDLLSRTCRYDYAEYALLVLPPDERVNTARGPSSILPLDDGYYEAILAAVASGLRVLVFPCTGGGDALNPLRRMWTLTDVRYGARTPCTVAWPDAWGGGRSTGCVADVHGDPRDEVWLRDDAGRGLVTFRPHGRGGFILAGYDTAPDSLDGPFRYDTAPSLETHTLARLLQRLAIAPDALRTGQTGCWKEFLHGRAGDFLIFYSHQTKALPVTAEFRTDGTPREALDLASGRRYVITPADATGWWRLRLRLEPRTGVYLALT